MHPFIQRALALIITVSAVTVMPAVWANHHEHKDHKGHEDPAAHSSSKSGEMSSGLINGEVRRIDTENRKLTIRHEAIPEFEMAAMTMIFGVADTIALDQLKVGDTIRFSLKKSEGKWRVVRIEN
jgi:Cu/Ag efflux protein CusF